MKPGRRAALAGVPGHGPRHAAIAGLAAGLALAPLRPAARPVELLATATIAGLLLAVARPFSAAAPECRSPSRRRLAAGLPLLAPFAIALAAGLALGTARVAAIDAGALRAEPEASVGTRGHVISPPRAEERGYASEFETAQGRVLLRVLEPEALRVGAELAVRGRLSEPPPWRADRLRRRGIALVLEAERLEELGSRGGVGGRVDAIRARAERALERGMPERESALARGFVLGQDDRIDPATRDDFRRSGLAHLLAVSGQNVLLLCLLAWPLLALAGVTLRARLLALLALVALYVPVTGAGPSIQRAGVMGAAGLIAALASRPAARWYALLLAAAVTLALNPHAGADVGWQLSFAAVAGIFLWSRRLADLLAAGAAPGSPRRALAEGAAMTAAATVATAPLIAHHFEALQLAALPANLAALPAVAPAMWLGMLAGIAGQLSALPVEPLNWLNSICLAYIAQVARWFGEPAWAQLELGLGSALSVALAYLALLGLAELVLAAAARRRGLGSRLRARLGGRRAVALVAALAALATAPALLARDKSAPAPATLAVRALDVGQGDAILLDPPASEPLLVDAGPPGAGLPSRLRDLGVESLAAIVISHDQSDHAGGLAELLRSLPVDRVALGAQSPALSALARASGAEVLRLAEGGELRAGSLRLTALWPPRELAASTADDPNSRSLVMVAEWRHFSILLTGDAEAEAVPLDSGPVDVLKVAHHGSADEGLASLLERTAPKLAVISVGANPYGHPAPPTLAELDEHGVPVARTDRGEVAIEADAGGWRLRGD